MHGNVLAVIWTLENVFARNKIIQPRPKSGNAQRKAEHNAEAKRNDLQSYAACRSLNRHSEKLCDALCFPCLSVAGLPSVFSIFAQCVAVYTCA